MLRIKPMRIADIRSAVRLTDQENWGVTEKDFRRVLRLTPSGSFIAWLGKKPVGVTTTIRYGKILGWIGNVVVDRGYRGRRFGQKLVERAVQSLQKSGTQHIGLYCFREQLNFYEALGFLADSPFLRLRRDAQPQKGQVLTWKHVKPTARMLSADRIAFGADRSELIVSVLREKAGWCTRLPENTRTGSYMMLTTSGDVFEIGPWICVQPGVDRPTEMLLRVLRHGISGALEISCLRDNRIPLQILGRHGFRTVREGFRMYYKERPKIGVDKAQFALGFLDKG